MDNNTVNRLVPINGTDANSQNPSITFDNEGLYTISLNASDGATSDVETKNNYIRVLPDHKVALLEVSRIYKPWKSYKLGNHKSKQQQCF